MSDRYCNACSSVKSKLKRTAVLLTLYLFNFSLLHNFNVKKQRKEREREREGKRPSRQSHSECFNFSFGCFDLCARCSWRIKKTIETNELSKGKRCNGSWKLQKYSRSQFEHQQNGRSLCGFNLGRKNVMRICVVGAH